MLRGADFFDVKRQPEVCFTSTLAEAIAPDHYAVRGVIEIRGCSNREPGSASLNAPIISDTPDPTQADPDRFRPRRDWRLDKDAMLKLRTLTEVIAAEGMACQGIRVIAMSHAFRPIEGSACAMRRRAVRPRLASPRMTSPRKLSRIIANMGSALALQPTAA
jgi:hypothetical protein